MQCFPKAHCQSGILNRICSSVFDLIEIDCQRTVDILLAFHFCQITVSVQSIFDNSAGWVSFGNQIARQIVAVVREVASYPISDLLVALNPAQIIKRSMARFGDIAANFGGLASREAGRL